ncbi:caveolae-associated protein 2a [Periophthalmus magnuspinnatus]|uniref:caveolae-associated protein 2a n=1 Tax=Periophthalmus magnuspinnatus TaxID=409849 RepID=UPI00145B30B9|nr:caveolae-associated protein 2a [Periophthalmus magnuspinnatus]
MEDEQSGSTQGSTRGSTQGSTRGSAHNLAAPAQSTPGSAQIQPVNCEDILLPSFSPGSAPSSPTPTGTLTRLGMSLRGHSGTPAPASPTERGQVSAITVVAILDKLAGMLESVQQNQQRMEQRQEELEGAVRAVQGDVTRLSKAHLNTANNVNKLLERSRKMNGGVKEVKERLDKQAVQVKRLENNHAHLLKRNHFKVLIFQEDNEIPTDVFVKDSLKSPLPQYDEPSVAGSVSAHPPSIAGSVSASVAPSVSGSVDVRSPEEGLHTVSLSSDEDEELNLHREPLDECVDADSTLGLGSSRPYERRADRFKRNSLKKVDSLKRAFTRQNIEKKMTQITTKIVPPEKRDKIIKSLTPNHPKSPTARASSFKVAPMTFNVKKVRDGQTPTPEASPSSAEAHVEIPPLGSLDTDASLELHADGGAVTRVREALKECSVQAELSVNGEVDLEVNGDDHFAGDNHSAGEEPSTEERAGAEAEAEVSGGAGLAVPESTEDVGEEEEEEEEEESPTEGATEASISAETTPSATIPTATIAVEQAS